MRRILIIVNFLLICFVSLYGIIDQSIYTSKLNTISFSELLGEDVSNLMFGIIGLVTAISINKTTKLLQLILLGLFPYFIYMYSYYCISLLSSFFYIAYLAIFGMSFFLFVFQIIAITKTDMVPNKRYPRRTISCFFFLVVLVMILLELPDVLRKTIIERKTITLFQEFYILDLSIVFPAIVIIAIMNLKQNRYGSIWSGLALIKILTIMPALLLNEIFYWIKNGVFLDFSFIIISGSFIIVSAFLLIQFKNGIDWNLYKIPKRIVT